MLSRLTLLAATALAAPALGQTTTTAPVPAGGLEEIIVTAQKRAENVQTVPLSLTVLSAETLATKRIVDFTDLTRVAPSLTITQSNQAVSNSINLRGIGTNAFSIGVEPSVEVVVDDVAIIQQGQAFDNLNDIERIEVLRGPQGTLFGKGASAGVVNVVTRDPSVHFSGGLNVSGTTDDELRVEAAISGPLATDIGFRLSAFYVDRKGYLNDLTYGIRLNGERGYGFRGKLRLGLSDRLSYTLNGSYSDRASKGVGSPFVSVPAGVKLFGLVPYAAALNGITPGVENRYVREDDLSPTTNRQYTFSARGQLELGFADLLSITSYQDWKYNFDQDADLGDLNVIGALTRGAVNGGLSQQGPYHATQVSQEFRLVSPSRGRFKYVAGLYYADATTSRAFTRGPVLLLANWLGVAGTRSLAAFGQGEFAVTGTTRLTGGVRVNNERINSAFTNFLPTATPPANNATCLATCTGSADQTAVTWKAALQHDLADQVMVFASAASGYKGQGYDISSGFTPARAQNPVKAERSRSYELGIKSRFFENKLQLNTTLFWTDYNNFQAQAGLVDPTTNPATVRIGINNVGKLRTRGVEADLTAAPTPALRFDASLAYVDAVIRSYPEAQVYTGQTVATGAFISPETGTLVQNLNGHTLSNAPKFKFNLGSTYEVKLNNNGLKGVLSFNYQHQSSVNYDLFGNPLTVQRAFGLWNGSIGLITDKATRFKVTAFVNNILNTHYSAAIGDNAGIFGAAHVLTQIVNREAQRYGGIRAGVEF